jgi:hypothetical protein
MTLTQMRRAGVKMNRQWTRSAATSPVNTWLCLPPYPPSLALAPIATRRTHLPPHSNPHSRVRRTFRAPSSAGSFLGGFRTTAPVLAAPSRSAVSETLNENGSELSCGNVPGTNTMPETATNDHPPVAKAAATVSASCERTRNLVRDGADGECRDRLLLALIVGDCRKQQTDLHGRMPGLLTIEVALK